MKIYVTQYFDKWDNLAKTAYAGTDEQTAFSFIPDDDLDKYEVNVEIWEDGKFVEFNHMKLGDTEWK